jgi:Dolichyl-phosphate-mannose-protein mannosyltransferase
MYFWKLNLLSPWFDEADQLTYLHTTLANSIAIPASGGHPPLYFFVIYYWMRLPFGLDWTVQARVLSVLFALIATVAADRFWAKGFPGPWRWAYLSLWALSPFLLLYARMSRSYSLQLLAGTLAAGCLMRFLEKRTWRWGVALTFSLALAMYVHYIPGGSLLIAANLMLLRRRQVRSALAVDAGVGLIFLPWIFRLLAFLPTWGLHGGNAYALTGGSLLEIPVKLAYWAFSFFLGEAVPDAVLLVGGAVMAAAAVLLVSGGRRRPDVFCIAAAAAVIGFIGVARWNSYPFIPARMIFLFPLFLTLLVSGAAAHRRLGPAVVKALLVLSVSGIWSYFHLAGFRNKQYPMPIAQIADKIRHESAPGAFQVLVDSTNSDPFALEYALGPVLRTADAAAADQVRRWLANPQIRTVWFLRNTHDVSPAQWDRRFEELLRPAMRETAFEYEPFTPLELRVAQAAGVKNPPRYFHELLKFER